ncbi:histidine phosphatase family protein [Paracoccaceae bacterium]|nr:histidine phosphatase family protein [Paracoccaceae bacterium]
MRKSTLNHPDLYILRHGETVWNRQGRFQGRKDSPLTEKGRQQTMAQRNLLNAVSFGQV